MNMDMVVEEENGGKRGDMEDQEGTAPHTFLGYYYDVQSRYPGWRHVLSSNYWGFFSVPPPGGLSAAEEEVLQAVEG